MLGILPISDILIEDDHDLIHKAVGWMLREIGKKNLKVEEEFIKSRYKKMPRTINNSPEMQKRIPVRLPSTMMSEVDRLVRKHSELNYNRQQFIESAVREKIERLIMLQSAKTNNTIVQVENLPKIMQ